MATNKIAFWERGLRAIAYIFLAKFSIAAQIPTQEDIVTYPMHHTKTNIYCPL